MRSKQPDRPILTENAALARFRRRQRLPWVIIPLMAVAFVLSVQAIRWIGPSIELLPGIVLCVGVASLFAARTVALSSKCPGCSRRASIRMIGPGFISAHCRHCMLVLEDASTGNTVHVRLLRLWIEHPHPRPPIPDVGLACPKCGYSLTGLVEERCPECGSAFSIASMIADGEPDAAGQGRR